MVQVDVFWSYGLGASLAVAAGRQLRKREKPFESRYFVWTLLFLALVWAPTGMLLLLDHPSWETMQAAATLYSMPSWLILAFGITNVTQGILGFWIGLQLIRRGRWYLANLNWIFGYFGMFFILVYGWDGLGFDRFFYDRDMLAGSPAWTPGSGATVATLGSAIPQFLVSGVAITLYIDGVYLLPPLFWLFSRWWREGLRNEGLAAHGQSAFGRLLLIKLAGVFIVALPAAIFCAVVVNYCGAALGVGNHVARALGTIPANTAMHVLSYLIGLPLALVMLWFVVLRPRGIVHRLLAPLCTGDEAGAQRHGMAAVAAP
jgi:hypothetical protein